MLTNLESLLWLYYIQLSEILREHLITIHFKYDWSDIENGFDVVLCHIESSNNLEIDCLRMLQRGSLIITFEESFSRYAVH